MLAEQQLDNTSLQTSGWPLHTLWVHSLQQALSGRSGAYRVELLFPVVHSFLWLLGLVFMDTIAAGEIPAVSVTPFVRLRLSIRLSVRLGRRSCYSMAVHQALCAVLQACRVARCCWQEAPCTAIRGLVSGLSGLSGSSLAQSG